MKASKHVIALSSMLMGPVLVFGLVILMNKFAGQLDKAPVQEVTEISMVKQPPPEPKKIVKKNRTQETADTNRCAASL